MDSIRVDRKIWHVALLSILLPGAGHWLLGQKNQAYFIASSFLFHLSLAYTLFHIIVIEQPISVVYLMLLIPYHYFYGIFNSLKLMSRHEDRNESPIVENVLTVLSILFVILSCFLWLPLDMFPWYKGILVELYTTALLLGSAAYLLFRLRKQELRYVFSLSSALCLLIFSILLELEREIPIAWEKWVLVFLVIPLMEGIFFILRRYQERNSRIYDSNDSSYTLIVDQWAIFITLILVVSGYFVTIYRDYPAKLLESLHAPIITQDQLDNESGFHYVLQPIKVSAYSSYRQLHLRHFNGNVTLVSGNVDVLTIYPELYINTDDEREALAVKEQSRVEMQFQNGLSIGSDVPSYRGNSYPRMNLIVVLPQQRRFMKTLDVRVDHGAVSVSHVVVRDQLKIESNTAAIELTDIYGGVELTSSSGSIVLNEVNGSIDVSTKKGDIAIVKPTSAVIASTLSGDIKIYAEQVLGSWLLDASVGNIYAALPKKSDYEMDAKVSYGEIRSVLFQNRHQSKSLHYLNGAATYQLGLYASHNIFLN